MPKNKKGKKAQKKAVATAAATAAAATAAAVAASSKKRTGPMGRTGPGPLKPLPWSDVVRDAYRGCAKIPDMNTLPSAMASSTIVTTNNAVTTSNYGYIAAVQLAPRNGAAGCYRTAASVTADVITWGPWVAAPNYTALAAGVAQLRAAAATLCMTVPNLSLTNLAGCLAAIVGPSANLAQATTGIVTLLQQPRQVNVDAALMKTVNCCFGFNCPNDYDYIPATNNSVTDGDADVLTVLAYQLPSGTIGRAWAKINWECNINDGASSILAVSPSVIDAADLQRGLRRIALDGDCWVSDVAAYGLGVQGASASGGAAGYPGSPMLSGPNGGTTSGEPAQTAAPAIRATATYLDHAASASGNIRTVVENAARTAAVVAGAYAANQVVQGRLMGR